MTHRSGSSLSGRSVPTPISSTDLSLSPLFAVHPQKLIFDNVENHVTHVLLLQLQNLSKQNRRIRVIPPTCTNFHVETSAAAGIVAPGLTITLRVSFQATEERAYQDRLIIFVEGGQSFEIPVQAFPPAAKIIFPSFVNLGTTVARCPLSESVEMRNAGAKTGVVSINFPNAPLSASPSLFVLPPGQSQRVLIEFRNDSEDNNNNTNNNNNNNNRSITELGPASFSGVVHTVTCDVPPASDHEAKLALDRRGDDEDTPQSAARSIEVSFNIVDQKLELVHADGKAASLTVQELAFPTIYFGQTDTLRATLVNNSPLPSPFVVALSVPELDEKNMTAAALINAETPLQQQHLGPSEVSVSPLNGTLAPYGEITLEFTFQPRPRADHIGYKSQLPQLAHSIQYNLTAVIESVNSKQQLQVPLSGLATSPSIAVSHDDLQFGECAVHEKLEATISIQNKSDALSVPFEFVKVAQFTTSPLKGKLLPLAQREITISYSPNQLGRFTEQLELIVAGGLKRVPIRLSGTSSSTGVPGSTATLGKADTLAMSIKQHLNTFKRPEVNYLDSDMDKPGRLKYAGTDDQIITRQENRKHGDARLRTFRVDREHRNLEVGKISISGTAKPSAQVMEKFYESHGLLDQIHLPNDDGSSLGMKFAQGLTSPRMALPNGKLCDMITGELAGGHLSGARADNPLLNPLKLIAKKFKTGPSTPAESRDCAATLTSEQLSKIDAATKMLDFGRVCVNSQTARNFALTNPLTQFIIVEIRISDPELKLSKPLTQVIPPGETAGFDILLSSPVVQLFKRNVYYVINEQHTYHFSCSADIVAISLGVSADDLQFRFSAENDSFAATQTVSLSNPFSIPIEYFWSTADEKGQNSAVFSVSPAKGVVPPGKSSAAIISYEPATAQKTAISELVNLHVVGGTKHAVKCTGCLPDTNCSLKPKLVEFGTVSVGSSTSKVITLRNNGKFPTVFQVNAGSVPGGVSVSPMKGSLDVGASFDLTVTFAPTVAVSHNSKVVIEYRGRAPSAKPLALDLEACSVVPDVAIEQPSVSFGGVIWGSTASVPVTIRNSSAIPVSLNLDLSAFAEFGLQYNREDGVVASANRPESGKLSRTCTTPGDEEPLRDSIFHFTVGAQSALNLQLTFTPSSLRSYEFTLPLQLKGLHNFPGIRRKVSGWGIQPQISLNPSSIDFHKRMILKRERAAKHPYSMKVQLKNMQNGPLSWRVALLQSTPSSGSTAAPSSRTATPRDVELLTDRKEELPEMVWRVEPCSGKLSSQEIVTLHVFFAPTAPVPYLSNIGVYVDDDKQGSSTAASSQPYLITALSGQGQLPSLTFDTPEVILPATPLNVVSKTIFHIKNQGYESLELRHILPADTSRVPISLSYPKGNVISTAAETIPVEVSLCSSKPLSFTSKITFLDTAGVSFSVAVSGCTDNSLLTVQDFVTKNQHRYSIGFDNNRVLHLLSHTELDKISTGRRDSAIVSGWKHSSQQHQQGSFDPTGTPKTVAQFGSSSARRKEEAVLRGQQSLQTLMAFLRALQILPPALASAIIAAGANASAELPSARPAVLASNSNVKTGHSARSAAAGSVYAASEGVLSSSNTGSVAPPVNATLIATMTQNRSELLFHLVETLAGIKLKTWAEQQKYSGDSTISSNGNSSGAAGMVGTSAANSALTSGPAAASTHQKQLFEHHAQLDLLVSFLTAHGAVLTGVHAENLLSEEQYSEFVHATVNTPGRSIAELQRERRHLIRRFAENAHRSWVAILFQIVKVFLLSRLTTKSFKSLPGVCTASSSSPTNNPVDVLLPTANRSNIYSVGELVLLHWLSYHYNKINGQCVRTMINFTSDLADGLVLAAVLQSHIPQLETTCFATLKLTPASADDCLHNAQLVLHAMKLAGLHFPLEAAQLCNPSACDMVLLCLYLYQVLPHYVPRSVVEFACKLNEEIVKHIEISNPSNKKSIVYNTQISGCADFSSEHSQITLAPKGHPGSVVHVPIKFRSRFTKPVEARLTLLSDANSSGGLVGDSAHAATVVFTLRSKVSAAVPVGTYTVTARCYEMQKVEVAIHNTFGVDCQFGVSLVQARPSGAHLRKKLQQLLSSIPGINGNSNGNNNSNNGAEAADSSVIKPGFQRTPSKLHGGNGGNQHKTALQLEEHASLPDAFFCPVEKLKLRQGESTTLSLHFLPFELGKHSCRLVLLDENVGECVYEISGSATAPLPTESFKWLMPEESSSLVRHLNIPYKNTMLEQNRTLVSHRYKQSVRGKNGSQEPPRWVTETPLPAAVLYSVTSSSPFFAVPKSKLVFASPSSGAASSSSPAAEKKKSNGDGGGVGAAVEGNRKGSLVGIAAGGGLKGEDNDSALKLHFTPRGPGVYKCELTLQSLYDVRVFDIQTVVTAKGVPATLEFVAAARQKIVQNIPLINNSEEIWNFKAHVGGGSGYFSGPTDVVVQPKSAKSYPLCFSPDWTGEVKGQLTLTNTKSSEKQVFDLVGRGEEPLAEEHVVMECKARTKTERKFRVKNESKSEMRFTVESDLPGVSGLPNFSLRGGQSMEYTLSLTPLNSGTFTGNLSFVASDHTYIWYGIELKVEAAPAESQINVKAFLHKAAAIDIAIVNPLAEDTIFDVTYQPTDCLSGSSELVLPASKEGVYRAVFTPQSAGFRKGIIAFSNPKIGQFWYDLNLEAENPPPTKLPLFRCPVGSTVSHTITLENPTTEPITMFSELSLPESFTLRPKIVAIAPNSSRVVHVDYTATSYNVDQHASLAFAHPALGHWLYQLHGIGVEPAPISAKVVSTPVHCPVSDSVVFRNPFSHAVSVMVTVQDARKQFDFLNQRFPLNTTIPVGGSLSVPFAFRPTVMSTALASVHVQYQDIEWTFPITGLVEGPVNIEEIEFKCQARQFIETEKSLTLAGLDFQPDGVRCIEDELSVEVVSNDHKQAAFLAHSLDVSIVKPGRISASRNRDARANVIRVKVLFEPLKPVATTGSLIIKRNSGGCWKFPCTFSASEPPIDDVINIEAPVNHSASVRFSLTNRFDHPAPFKAFFSSSSAPEFSFYPSKGVLPPVGADPQAATAFQVSFAPTVYGKPLVAHLIIQTEDMQWTYEFRGDFPKYIPPVIAHGQLDNKLSSDVLRKLDAKKPLKNYLSHNKHNALPNAVLAATAQRGRK